MIININEKYVLFFLNKNYSICVIYCIIYKFLKSNLNAKSDDILINGKTFAKFVVSFSKQLSEIKQKSIMLINRRLTIESKLVKE